MIKKLLAVFAGIVAVLSGWMLWSNSKSDFNSRISNYAVVELIANAADAVCDCPPNCVNEN